MDQGVKIKICGVRTPDVAEAAVEAGADYLGLVFVPQSPRYVTVGEAHRITEAIGERIEPVAVFRDQSGREILDLLAPLGRVRTVQLHGLSRDAISQIAGYRAFCALSFGDAIKRELDGWSEAARDPSANLDALVIDTPDPTGLGGGTGERFDWRALRDVLDEIGLRLPVILAGGLTPDNVAEAVRTVRPWGVDVSSGVESTRGVKDPARIKAFCQAVRRI